MQRKNTLMVPKAEGGFRYIDIKPVTKFKEPLRILQQIAGTWTEEQTPFFEVKKEWVNLASFTAFDAAIGKNRFVAASRESEDTWLILEKRGNKFRMWEGQRENILR